MNLFMDVKSWKSHLAVGTTAGFPHKGEGKAR